MLPPTLFRVQLASLHKLQGLVLVHGPKLRNQQLRCIWELKCFTRFFWTQPKASKDRRSPLLLRHVKIPVVTVTEGPVMYEMFIFVLLFPGDTVVITVSAPRPLFRQCYLSAAVLQRQFSITVPPAARHSSFVSQPSPYKSSLVLSRMPYCARKHNIKRRTFTSRSDTSLLLSHYQNTLLKHRSPLAKYVAITWWKRAIILTKSIWSDILISS